MITNAANDKRMSTKPCDLLIKKCSTLSEREPAFYYTCRSVLASRFWKIIVLYPSIYPVFTTFLSIWVFGHTVKLKPLPTNATDSVS